MIGTVTAIWRYPVKGMRGEEVEGADVTAHGVRGDRCYAVFDPITGRVASAKHPRKWARLFDCHATYEAEPHGDSPLPPVRITLPDGEAITSERPDRDAILARALGRDASLITRPPTGGTYEASWPAIDGVVPVGESLPSEGEETMTALPVALAAPKETFFDGTVIHLLTTASLRRLRALYPEGDFDVRRFRPNIVVEIPDEVADFVENGWVGKSVAIGETLRLSVMLPCPRCVMPTLSQGDMLPRDVGILRTIARNNQQPVLDMGNMGCAGVYADVAEPGFIRCGDPVRLI
jgi:hypothetical protein